MRVLIVEDSAEKLQQISACVFESGVPEDALRIAGSVVDAKRALAEAGFDLLILDINLPTRADQSPQKDGGLEILRWLKAKGSAHRPAYIVGTTAYDDAYRSALSEFDNLIWNVIPFSFGNNAWRPRLGNAIATIKQQLVPPFVSDGVTYRIELGVVTALESELAAVRDTSTNWERIPVRNDEGLYFSGTFQDGESKVEFVATCAADKGLPGAAVATTKLIDAFHPRYVAMTGICAGVKGKVGMGDILVADPTWDWGSGKFKQRGGVEEFHPASYQMRLDEGLRNRVLSLKSNSSWLADTKAAFKGDVPVAPLGVHVGAVASGASVLQSSEAVKRLIAQHKDLIGVEMEIFSLMFACHTASLPRPKAIAVKSVCDFGDRKKNNKYQPYAAYTSASALRKLVLDGLTKS